MLSCSNGTVVIATAMVCSSTALFLAMARQFHGNHQNPKILDQTLRPILRSRLSSGTILFSGGRMVLIDFPGKISFSWDAEEKKKQRKKIKKVRFADNVKDTKGNGKEYRRRELNRRIVPEPETKPGKTVPMCRISTMPANRMALYNGILRDRDQRIQCSY